MFATISSRLIRLPFFSGKPLSTGALSGTLANVPLNQLRGAQLPATCGTSLQIALFGYSSIAERGVNPRPISRTDRWGKNTLVVLGRDDRCGIRLEKNKETDHVPSFSLDRGSLIAGDWTLCDTRNGPAQFERCSPY